MASIPIISRDVDVLPTSRETSTSRNRVFSVEGSTSFQHLARRRRPESGSFRSRDRRPSNTSRDVDVPKSGLFGRGIDVLPTRSRSTSTRRPDLAVFGTSTPHEMRPFDESGGPLGGNAVSKENRPSRPTRIDKERVANKRVLELGAGTLVARNTVFVSGSVWLFCVWCVWFVFGVCFAPHPSADFFLGPIWV